MHIQRTRTIVQEAWLIDGLLLKNADNLILYFTQQCHFFYLYSQVKESNIRILSFVNQTQFKAHIKLRQRHCSFQQLNFWENIKSSRLNQPAMTTIIKKISNIFSLLILFYFFSIRGLIKSFIEVKNSSRFVRYWILEGCKYLQVKMKRIPSEYEMRTQKTIFLLNHRTQCDFFIHPLIFGTRASFLARRQVGYMFGLISLFLTKAIWFFNRSGQINIDKFNNWLDNKFAQVGTGFLAVYPEGHRMYNTKKVEKEKIKRGMIKYAFSRGIPVQFIMSFGNQNVLNQKQLKISYGGEITYKFGKVIDPKDFSQASQFINVVLDQFVKFFDETLKDTENKVTTEDTTEGLLQALDYKNQ